MLNFQDHEQKAVVVGPWGSQSGSSWDDGVYSAVRQIIVTHGAGVDSIQIEYDKQGSPVWGDKHGGNGGYKTDQVKLAYPEEFLISINGYYGHLYAGGPICVRSLTFVSNLKTHGPFGVDQGSYFYLPKTGDRIVGFHGRSGWHLDAIGAYMNPIHQKNESNTVVYSQNFVANAADKNSGYSVIHGSLGKEYDIVLAIKQRDNMSSASPKVKGTYTLPPHATLSGQSSSSDSSDDDSKEKVLANPLGNEKRPSVTTGVVTHGPWGGSGGTVFDDGCFIGIRQITISRNVGIVYLKVLYEKDGKGVRGGRCGGTGGFKTDKIVFDYPYEILTHITGYYGSTMISPTIIKSLTFHTTKTKYGPYGEEHGVPFSSKSKEGMIVGFHGKRGLFLDAIGVHLKEGKVTPQLRPPMASHDDTKRAIEGKVTPQMRSPMASHDDTKRAIEGKVTPQMRSPMASHDETKRAIVGDPLWPSKPHVSHDDTKRGIVGDPLWPSKPLVSKGAPYELPAFKVVKEPAPCGTGPWGGEGGKPWDDGVYTGIKQIYLTKSQVICSIQIEYDRNGQSVWSVRHGGNTDTTASPHRIKLEFPHEVLTCISGYYSTVGKDNIDHAKVIRSLTFYTSRGKYGPFGDEVGTFFTSTTTEGKILGFHGRSGSYLDAIGVHMQHWLGSYNQPKSSFFNMFA
ncbi:jacalin-related lectin 3 [Silene latifolia]|uniref:jacalin-related lectin 3 n=1 Tax=Silene latifolia TaxID=37657 RepID=UPI003D77CD19